MKSRDLQYFSWYGVQAVGGPALPGSIPRQEQEIFLSFKTSWLAHTASYAVGTGGSILDGKVAGT